MNEKNPESFQVGDALKCLIFIERQDRQSYLSPGDIVKVVSAFSFTFNGKPCQDIVVQKDDYAPISVLAEPGRFERIGVPDEGGAE